MLPEFGEIAGRNIAKVGADLSWEINVSCKNIFNIVSKINKDSAAAMKVVSFEGYQECFQDLYSEVHNNRMEVLWRQLCVSHELISFQISCTGKVWSWESNVSCKNVSNVRRFKLVSKIEKDSIAAIKVVSSKCFTECFQDLYSCWQKFVTAEGVYFEGYSVSHMILINLNL